MRKFAEFYRIPHSRVPRGAVSATCKCTEWSDGSPTVQDIADACLERGYQYAAVTDHSYGLKIAGGMSMAEAVQQRKAIDDVNVRCGKQFRLLQGIEANIDAAGQLDLTDDEAVTFDVVLAAPHSRLRRREDQTDRMLAAVAHQAVRILAHPRGRITGSRAGVIANWDAVFTSAAERRGDRNRRRSLTAGLDHTLAVERWRRGVSSHSTAMRTPPRSSVAETALAHARLAGIPAERIVNCWPLDRLLAWLSNPLSERRP